jgi:biopolymer transport protein ExbD
MKMPRRRRPDIAVPTASMGDIAFLLTIFFMVCSNFAKEAGIKWTEPRAPQLRAIKESNVSVSIDAEGIIFLQGQPVPDAGSVEAGVTVLLQRRGDADERLVMFKCDRAVDKAVFEPVIAAIARAGGVMVAIGEDLEAP